MTTALWTHLAKDLRLEWRSKDAINAMLFFALLVVVIFSFAFDPTAEESRPVSEDHRFSDMSWTARHKLGATASKRPTASLLPPLRVHSIATADLSSWDQSGKARKTRK